MKKFLPSFATIGFLSIVASIVLFGNQAFGQAGQKFASGGNTLSNGEFFGTLNNFPIIVKVNNTPRASFTTTGFDVYGNLHATKNTMVDSILTSWQVMITDALSVGGNLSVSGAATFNSNATINGILKGGLISISGNNITSDNGNILFDGNNLTTTGNITSKSATIDGIKIVSNSINSSTNSLSFGNNNLNTTGNVNASNISALQSTVSVHDSLLNNHQSQLTANQSAIAGHDSVLIDHQSAIDTLQNSVSDIQSTIGNITSSQWQNIGTNNISYTGNATVNGNFQASSIGTGQLTISDKFTAPKGEFDTVRAARQLFVNHNLVLGSDSGTMTSDIASRVDMLRIQSETVPAAMARDVTIVSGNEGKIGIGMSEGLIAKFNVQGNSQFYGDLNVIGNANLSGNITSQGIIEANIINASNINLNGTPFSNQFLSVSGDTMAGNITLASGTSINHGTSNAALTFDALGTQNVVGLGFNAGSTTNGQGLAIAPAGTSGYPNGVIALADANPAGQVILGLGTGATGTRINLNGALGKIVVQNDGGDRLEMGGVNAPTLWESTQGFNLAPRSGFSGTHLLDVQGSINAQQYYVNGTLIDVAAIDSTLDTLQLALSGMQTSQWKKDTMNTVNIFYNSGNIGIGTSAPVTKLDVFGDQRITGNLFVGGELSVSDKFSAQTIVTDTIKPTVTGTAVQVAAPMRAAAIRVDTLLVSDKFTATNSVSSDTLVAVKQLDVNHNLSLGSDSGSAESDIASKVSVLTIQSDPAKAYNTAINADNTGMVGIGTRYPTEKLTVDGNVSVSGTMQANQISTTYLTISDGFSAPRGDFDSLNVLKEFTSASRIKSDTMFAVKQLDVNHNLSLGSDSGSAESDIASKVANLTIQSDPAATYNVVMSADNNTRVGIGDKYPTEKLTVQGNVKVSGDIVAAGNLNINGNFTFGGNKKIGFTPASGNNPPINSFGMWPPWTPVPDPCYFAQLNGVTQNQFEGMIQSWGFSNEGANSNVMSMGFDGANAIIDIAGNNDDEIAPRLLMNYYCGKDIFMCTGSNGGNISMCTSDLGNVGIGVSSTASEKLEVNGNIRVSDSYDLLLRNSHHGLGWYGTTSYGGMAKKFAGKDVDGPVLYGYSGGALGVYNGSGKKIALLWDGNGNVGIGTDNPQAKLHVATAGSADYAFAVYEGSNPNMNFLIKGNGEAYARDVFIYAVGVTFPDYVFGENYTLAGWEKERNNWKKNKHLLGMPSANDVEKAGAIDMKELQLGTLKKLEELYLYVDELKKEMEKQKLENEALKKEIGKINSK